MSLRNTVQLLLALIWTLSSPRKFVSAHPPPSLTISRDLCSEVGAANCELEANRTETIACSLSVCHQDMEGLPQSHLIEFHIVRRAIDTVPVREGSSNYYLGPINMSGIIRHGNTCVRTLSFNTTQEMDLRTFQCQWRGPNGEELFSNALILAIAQGPAASSDPTPPMPIPTACDPSTVTVTRRVTPSCTTTADDAVLQTLDHTAERVKSSTAQTLRHSNLLLLVLLLSVCIMVVCV